MRDHLNMSMKDHIMNMCMGDHLIVSIKDHMKMYTKEHLNINMRDS